MRDAERRPIPSREERLLGEAQVQIGARKVAPKMDKQPTQGQRLKLQKPVAPPFLHT